jgi:lipopolysaccharide biosynthesis regulator YciM
MSSQVSILNPAIGYLELGMFDEANEEIENLAPELKNSSDALTVRMEIYRAMKNWKLMEVVTRQLWKRHQDNPSFWNELAFASRHSSGLKEAHSILCEALKQFPYDSLTLYNLAATRANWVMWNQPR